MWHLTFSVRIRITSLCLKRRYLQCLKRTTFEKRSLVCQEGCHIMSVIVAFCYSFSLIVLWLLVCILTAAICSVNEEQPLKTPYLLGFVWQVRLSHSVTSCKISRPTATQSVLSFRGFTFCSVASPWLMYGNIITSVTAVTCGQDWFLPDSTWFLQNSSHFYRILQHFYRILQHFYRILQHIYRIHNFRMELSLGKMPAANYNLRWVMRQFLKSIFCKVFRRREVSLCSPPLK